MAPRRHQLVVIAAALLFGLFSSAGQAQPAQVNTIKDVFAKLRTCWKPPPPSRANPGIDITVIVSFNRAGDILGHPKITYESEQATENDRVEYRIAVMETLQRCTPMPLPNQWPAPLPAGRSLFSFAIGNYHPNP